MKNSLKLLLAWLVVINLFLIHSSCKKNNDDVRLIEPPQFEDIADIATFQGNAESNIVIINTQGGPITVLEESELHEIRKATQTEHVLYVNVHQAQTLNPGKFNQTDISFEQAKAFDTESLVHLEKVVSFFKALGNKKVYVLGISFGAFMVQELIAQYGIDVADGYLISAGRLNLEEEFWMGFSQGKIGFFTYDAGGNATFALKSQNSVEDRNMSRLASGIGHRRYIDLLADIGKLTKVTYIAGDRDEEVGKLTQEEIAFLSSNGATVHIIPNADHTNAIDRGLALYLKSAFTIE